MASISWHKSSTICSDSPEPITTDIILQRETEPPRGTGFG